MLVIVSGLQRQQVSPGAEPKVVVTCVGDGVSLTFATVEGLHPAIGARLHVELTTLNPEVGLVRPAVEPGVIP